MISEDRQEECQGCGRRRGSKSSHGGKDDADSGRRRYFGVFLGVADRKKKIRSRADRTSGQRVNSRTRAHRVIVQFQQQELKVVGLTHE